MIHFIKHLKISATYSLQSSQNEPILLKFMTSPLKDHTNTTSMEGSWDTWQGRTILANCNIHFEGGTVITVLSVEKKIIVLKLYKMLAYSYKIHILNHCAIVWNYISPTWSSTILNKKIIFPLFKYFYIMQHKLLLVRKLKTHSHLYLILK